MASSLKKGQRGFNILLDNYKRSAKRRGYSFGLTPEQFSDFTTRDCLYCGQEPKNTKFSYDKTITPSNREYGTYTYNGIDRVDNSIGYEFDNCVPCCSICNTMKSALEQQDFLDHIDIMMTHMGTI